MLVVKKNVVAENLNMKFMLGSSGELLDTASRLDKNSTTAIY